MLVYIPAVFLLPHCGMFGISEYAYLFCVT